MGIACKIEVKLISHDGKSQCLDQDWTEDIEFIGVQFIGLENPVLQDIMNRLTALEAEVKSLKVKSEILEIARCKNFMRVLIEKGRNILLKEHETLYMNN